MKDMIELMRAVSDHGLTEFELEYGDTKLVMKREKQIVMVSGINSDADASVHLGENRRVEKEKPEENLAADGQVIKSPLVGTFYSAPSPEAEAFVKVGERVKKGQVVGIVEAMKLMNEIESEFDGVVEAVLAENETVVEYGQPLFRIR